MQQQEADQIHQLIVFAVLFAWFALAMLLVL